MATETRKRVRLGDLLLEKKLISEQQLKQALDEQRVSGRKLGRVLIDIGVVSEADLHTCLATYLNIPFVDLAHMSFEPKVVTKLLENHARRHRALVLKEDQRGYLVAMADPTDLHAYDELARLLGKPIRLALAKEAVLLKTIDSIYRRTDEIVSLAEELDEELSDAGVDLQALSAEEGSPDAPVIKLIQSMFQDAVQVNASDIHIEPDERCLRIRQRVDGLLQEQVIEGNRVGQALITRLKLMCGLDIAEKRKPQDGRFSIKVEDKSLDVRVSTMPIYHGEAIVLRLLDHSASQLTFDQLGMPAEIATRFKTLIERESGMVLVTGPTGSGKTTTLYAALNHLNSPATKIITAEDPVEYRLSRVNQVQVNAKIGLTFAAILRNALRHDPDIVLVGEMRDQETVEMGLRAAMTGHLVFSTLHTTDAASAVSRLLDMDAQGYLIAAALDCVLAQRLVRRVCDNCTQPAELGVHHAAWLSRYLGAERVRAAKLVEGVGCTYCNMTGYKGRVGVYELVEIDAGMADAIRRADLTEFERRARESRGFVSLVERAIQFAIDGVTSADEVMRSMSGVGADDARDLLDDVLGSAPAEGDADTPAAAAAS
ncbi:MAG TPA: GspE/PulE family protein [Gammaproteobacteria bacterium]|nr:GspE/PulE family protein [Gammaproteobacteria bacterium]